MKRLLRKLRAHWLLFRAKHVTPHARAGHTTLGT